MSDRFELFTPAVAADPYPLYHRLRAEEPVHWHERLGGWLLTRHADVQLVLRDPRFLALRGCTDCRPICHCGNENDE